jgi:hypothetical protein
LIRHTFYTTRQTAKRGTLLYDKHNVVYVVGGDLGHQRALAAQAFCHALAQAQFRQIVMDFTSLEDEAREARLKYAGSEIHFFL